MRLSDLTTGQEAVITGIEGDGSIQRRLNEMGYIAGRRVKAIKAAPLKDPVEYQVMDYKLTIRQKDASRVLIEPPARKELYENPYTHHNWLQQEPQNGKNEKKAGNGKTIHVALVGNPNCGKTTIFNHATKSRERVANYSGVTVAAKEAVVKIDGYTIRVIDLPGTYSLASYSPEEMFVTDYLLFRKPDVVINVLDTGNLERNLFVTTQLIDTGLKTVVALNMFDELKNGKGELDHVLLGEMLGIPFIPTIGTRGKGIKELFRTVIKVYKEEEEIVRPVRIPYSDEIENASRYLRDYLEKLDCIQFEPNRKMTLQLLSGDKEILHAVPEKCRAELEDVCLEKRKSIESLLYHDLNTEIVNVRYGFIEGALSETYKRNYVEKISSSQKIDGILTHKYLGLPIFFLFIWFMFFCTFRLGEYPMNWIDSAIGLLSGALQSFLPGGILTSLLSDGIIGGVGGVMVFLPNIMILFFLISVMEDSGYMARTAFLMDRIMHRAGLHGKSFIPLLMGFGCNVPAIMATRTIESKRDRLVTMFIIPFMSCSARLPVYVLFISAFFPRFQSGILFIIYSIGIVAALLTAIILNKTVFRKTESPFVMEMPPYRLPTFKAVGKHTWYKTLHFLKKMGTVILFASIIIWALGYFPRNKEIITRHESNISELVLPEASGTGIDPAIEMDLQKKISEIEVEKNMELLEQSYISKIGKAVQPVFAPLGFDWKMSVSILTGLMAKEVVVSSMGILYQAGTGADENSTTLVDKLRASREENSIPLVTYFGFLVYTLLYFPCFGTLIAIRKETSRLGWTLFAAGYPLVFAWITTFIIYRAGLLIGW